MQSNKKRVLSGGQLNDVKNVDHEDMEVYLHEDLTSVLEQLSEVRYRELAEEANETTVWLS